MKKEIDNDPNLSAKEKQALKEKKEAEMRKLKDSRVKEVEQKLLMVQTKQEEYK